MAVTSFMSKVEEVCEGIFFRVRWLLVPSYMVLIAGLGLLVYKTIISTIHLFYHVHDFDENTMVVQILGIVDIVLVTNLLLMVIFVGYVNFVSKIHIHKSEDKPVWLEKLSYSGLKVQMMGSILAISSVKLLRAYFGIGTENAPKSEDLKWLIAIYITFVIALICVALTDRLQHASDDPTGHPEAPSGSEDGHG